MGLTRLTAPQKSPVATADLRRWIGWDESDATHDADLQMLALDAADMIERFTRRSFMRQSWRWLTCLERVYEIPRPPLVSVDSFLIYDRDGDSVAVESADYQLIADRSPSLLVMDDAWVRPDARGIEPVVIEFTAGYGAADDDDDGESAVPREVKTSILQMVAMNFEHRGDTSMDLPMHVQAKLRGLTAGTVTSYFAGRV